jgi:serine/threonine-protein kinase
MRLLTVPPRKVPEEARAEMLADAIAAQRTRLRAASAPAVAWCGLSALSLLNGVRSVPLAVAFVGTWAAAAVACLASARRPHPEGKLSIPLLTMLMLATATTSLAFGPFALVPTLATFHVMAFLANPDRTRRWLVAAGGLGALVLPLALEWAGAIAPSYRFADGALVIMPRLFAFSGAWTIATLVVGNVVLLGFAFVMMARFRDALTDAERRLYLQSWQLRQLAP